MKAIKLKTAWQIFLGHVTFLDQSGSFKKKTVIQLNRVNKTDQ